tara:strand:+ start:4472 stop:5038 length:567 start_codon:yes stop_codon:yes gene_type:complete
MVVTVGTFLLGAGASTAAAGAVGTLVVGGALAGTAATIRSVKESKESARLARRAAETRLTMQKQEAARSRRQAVRANILRRAQARAQAQAAGVETSSGFAGAMGSLSSQLGTNLGYGSQMSGLGEQYTTLTGDANLAASRAQTFQKVASLGFSAAMAPIKYQSTFKDISTSISAFNNFPTTDYTASAG